MYLPSLRTNSMDQSPWEAKSHSTSPEGSLPWSQELCPEKDESIPQLPTLFL